MKKCIFLIIVILIFITGCADKYQVSDLNISKGNFIEGVFKNNSNNHCTFAIINLEIISGTLKLDETVSIVNVEPGEIKNIYTYCEQCKNLKVLNNIDIKVKKIKCSE